MRTIPYSYVLNDAVEMWSGESSASSYDARIFNRHIRKRATEFWEMFFWPEWTPIEERQFRPTWSSVTTYHAGDTVYVPQMLAYYQCVATNTNQPPVTNCVLHAAYWAVALSDYSGLPQYDPTASYAVGDQVNWSTTQSPYQCIAATTPGTDPSNTGSWGELVEFVRNIDFTQAWEANTITECKKIYDLHPWIHGNANEVPFVVTDQGLICRRSPTVVWAEFRLMAPRWDGPVFSSTATYANGTTVYFNSGTSSDFWTASGSPSAGETPLTNPNNWTLVPFPYVFRECAAQAAYADVLKIDGQADKAEAEIAEATRLLQREFDKLERQQGQTRPMKVVNRFNANAAW